MIKNNIFNIEKKENYLNEKILESNNFNILFFKYEIPAVVSILKRIIFIYLLFISTFCSIIMYLKILNNFYILKFLIFSNIISLFILIFLFILNTYFIYNK